MEEYVGSAGNGGIHKGIVPKEEEKDQHKDLGKAVVPHRREDGDRRQREEDEKEEQ